MLGVAVGGFATQLFPPEQLIWGVVLSGIAILAAASLTVQMASEGGNRTRAAVQTGTWAAVRFSAQLPFARLLMLAAVLFAAAYNTLWLVFSDRVEGELVSLERIVPFVGTFNSVAVVAALIGSVVASRALPKLGIVRGGLLLPIVYLGGFALIAASPGLATVTGVRFLQMLLMKSVAVAAFEALYQALPSQYREQLRAFVRAVPQQIGVAVSGLAVTGVWQAATDAVVPVVGLVVAGILVVVMWRLGNLYTRAIKDSDEEVAVQSLLAPPARQQRVSVHTGAARPVPPLAGRSSGSSRRAEEDRPPV